MTRPVTYEDLDPVAALRHAERIVKLLKDGAYTAPDLYPARVLPALAREMNGIATSMRLITDPEVAS